MGDSDKVEVKNYGNRSLPRGPIMKRTRLSSAPARSLQSMLLLAAVATASLIAQEPTPLPALSPAEARHQEMQRELTRQLEIANLQKQLAEARKAALDALPNTKISPVSANAAMTGENVLTDMIVYGELERAMANIATSVRSSVESGSTIVIYDGNSFADWKFYRRSLPLFNLVIDELTADYCRIAMRKPVKVDRFNVMGLSSGLVQSGNVVGQFADLLSYFRTETTVAGTSVTVSENAAVASLFPKLTSGSGITLLYPKTYGIDSPMFCGDETGPRPCCEPTQGEDCKETRPRYCSDVARSFDKLYRARHVAYDAKPDAQDLRKLEEYFKDFLSLFVEEPTTNVETAIKKYVNAEQFAAIADKERTYFLEIVPIKATGSTRIRKNLFFLSDKVDYAGGVVIQWTLLDRSGNIKNSGIESAYRGYLTPKEMQRVVP